MVLYSLSGGKGYSIVPPSGHGTREGIITEGRLDYWLLKAIHCDAVLKCPTLKSRNARSPNRSQPWLAQRQARSCQILGKNKTKQNKYIYASSVWGLDVLTKAFLPYPSYSSILEQGHLVMSGKCKQHSIKKGPEVAFHENQESTNLRWVHLTDWFLISKGRRFLISEGRRCQDCRSGLPVL